MQACGTIMARNLLFVLYMYSGNGSKRIQAVLCCYKFVIVRQEAGTILTNQRNLVSFLQNHFYCCSITGIKCRNITKMISSACLKVSWERSFIKYLFSMFPKKKTPVPR